MLHIGQKKFHGSCAEWKQKSKVSNARTEHSLCVTHSWLLLQVFVTSTTTIYGPKISSLKAYI